MKSVGTYEAKTHLPRLLSRVQRGESFTITRRGKPIARIVPATKDTASIASVIEEMLAYRDEHGPVLGDDVKVRQMIEEGRR
jgi:prevent-host-death family protein